MARLSFRCAPEMVERVDRARGGMPRETWLREVVDTVLWNLREGRPSQRPSDAPFVPLPVPTVEQALSEANEGGPNEQADPAPVPSLEGVRSAASAEQPLSRSEMFRRATKKN